MQQTHWYMHAVVGTAFLGGIVFWACFNTAIELSNTMTFCISCHEMRDTVFKEYQTSLHYENRTGVQATCGDCHVPRQWDLKVKRKIHATRELIDKLMGSIDTPEKFEAKRVEMARRVWASMRENDSQECRNCHSFSQMSEKLQKEIAWQRHQEGKAEGKTCIDCHAGIAHKDVSDFDELNLSKKVSNSIR